jgi:hypothetical protein
MRKDTTISLIRPGQDAEVQNRFAREKLLEPLAANSEGQITCAKIWHRCRRIIEQNASPRYAQTFSY